MFFFCLQIILCYYITLHRIAQNNIQISVDYIRQMRSHSNRTIQEEQDSLSLNQNTQVHQYNLDYSDEERLNNQECFNQPSDSSSDDHGRDISLQQLQQQLLSSNQMAKRPHKNSNDIKHLKKQDYFKNSFSLQKQKQKLSKKYLIKQRSGQNSYKQSQYSPTYDSTYLNVHQVNDKNKHRSSNDPQKSSYKKHEVHQFRNKSFNYNKEYLQQNSKRNIEEFNIQNYMSQKSKPKTKSKNNGFSGRMKPTKNDKVIDDDFTLITLPQVDSQFSSIRKSQNKILRDRQNQQKYHSREQQQQYQNEALQWRYQQAKLKFMDNFMPESLKIANNSYNLLKYINHKRDLSFNLLKISHAK